MTKDEFIKVCEYSNKIENLLKEMYVNRAIAKMLTSIKKEECEIVYDEKEDWEYVAKVFQEKGFRVYVKYGEVSTMIVVIEWKKDVNTRNDQSDH